MRFASSIGARRPEQPVSRSLPDLVGLAFDQMPSARHCDVQIRRLTQERIVVSADPDAVIQIVTNVLSNAAKYSPHGTPIEVELKRVDGKGLVTVRGPGDRLRAGAEGCNLRRISHDPGATHG